LGCSWPANCNPLTHTHTRIHHQQHFDLDNDGFITRDELEAALKQAASGDMAALGNDVTRVLLETDTDGDGRINYAEVRAYVQQ
jgi:Ca2+-binding EF-hand superfamily protein